MEWDKKFKPGATGDVTLKKVGAGICVKKTVFINNNKIKLSPAGPKRNFCVKSQKYEAPIHFESQSFGKLKDTTPFQVQITPGKY